MSSTLPDRNSPRPAGTIYESDTSVSTPTTSFADTDSTIATSKIVRTAIAVGVIIIIVGALICFLKFSNFIRYKRRVRIYNTTQGLLQNEKRATAYEIAAWSDQPGTAPIKGEPKRKKEKKKTNKRGGANAFAVAEWEGVAQ